eukprot:CAMPEP_0116892298 /NCGR_PEP_ID=MMETSP0467-20121206/2560_1 /TAXON_ID=283647 /ORGANISM="Mesodinium pulex, Strain SPMC105" /LENGTH=149 /DNA_ID=CAMNT_0004561365 /DNA_START=591 /DNA_END=1040 /DNA_ORIENTATION=-
MVGIKSKYYKDSSKGFKEKFNQVARKDQDSRALLQAELLFDNQAVRPKSQGVKVRSKGNIKVLLFRGTERSKSTSKHITHKKDPMQGLTLVGEVYDETKDTQHKWKMTMNMDVNVCQNRDRDGTENDNYKDNYKYKDRYHNSIDAQYAK